MKDNNILEVINRISAENMFFKQIEKLEYPFLRKLSRKPKILRNEIGYISALAHQAFSEGESLESDDIVVQWQKASPASWLVAEFEGRVCGYIHVEPIKGEIGDLIRTEKAHEGDITSEYILKDGTSEKEDYIHIGSIVSKRQSNTEKRNIVALKLLAGVADRVLDLMFMNNTPTQRVLAVDYPDSDGNHHAINLFKRYGFLHEHGEQTSERPPNDVYVLHLNKNETNSFYQLKEAVLAKRLQFLLTRKNILNNKVVLVGMVAVTLIAVFLLLGKPIIASITIIGSIASIVTYIKQKNHDEKRIEKVYELVK